MADDDLPRSLLLPVETTNREFDGKLLLAMKALERGYEPIIGSRTAMHAILPSLPKSIYLAKGARSGSAKVFSLLEALGHVIVALDEEALVRFPDEAFHMSSILRHSTARAFSMRGERALGIPILQRNPALDNSLGP